MAGGARHRRRWRPCVAGAAIRAAKPEPGAARLGNFPHADIDVAIEGPECRFDLVEPGGVIEPEQPVDLFAMAAEPAVGREIPGVLGLVSCRDCTRSQGQSVQNCSLSKTGCGYSGHLRHYSRTMCQSIYCPGQCSDRTAPFFLSDRTIHADRDGPLIHKDSTHTIRARAAATHHPSDADGSARLVWP